MRLWKWDISPWKTENPEPRGRRGLVWLFIVAEGILYIWFLISDYLGVRFLISADIVKYISIWVCFFMALYLFAAGQGNPFMLLAQALILPADFILLFADWVAPAGIFIFTGVQFCYFCRISQTYKKFSAISELRFVLTDGAAVAGLSLLSLIVITVLNISFDLLTVLAIFYISFFFANCVCALYEAVRFREKSGLLFAVGLILFLCCDICVGFNFMKGSFTEGTWIAQAASASNFLIWLFYLPGQVLLVLSGIGDNKK